jgi:hypothetical protein
VSDLWEFINGVGLPVMAMQSDHAWPATLHRFVGLGGYTAAVFVLGYLTARARWAALLETANASSSPAIGAVNAARKCDNILAEIRQGLDTHSNSTRRLNEQLDSSDRNQICDQAKETRDENSRFQEFLDDRCSQLEQHSERRDGTLSTFIKSMAGHRRRASDLNVVLAKFKDRDQFESAISPLRDCIRDLQDHNKRL